MRKLLITLALTLLLTGGSTAYGQVNRTNDLMPVPLQLTANAQRLIITKAFRVAVKGRPDDRMYAESSRFMRRLGEKTGLFLDQQGFVTSKDNNPSAPLLIQVRRSGKLHLGEDESYTLEINNQQAVLTAPTDLGAIHGLETLLQLVSTDQAGYFFPGVLIKDEPRFAWRGLLLDVALHFMPLDVIKRTLDAMAAVKLNVLHLHLANDQGFRVESKVFPKLQRLASDGMYYTQEDVKKIIAYAGLRGIRIVPEFVVPAHTTAILTAFPELGSVKRHYALQRYFGVFDPVLDPTNEKVWVFLDRLFGEMTSLFPDAFFHIGGDENTGKDWVNTPHIASYMNARGMKKYMDLQTAFNRRLMTILKKYKKTMMGWDEILQPGVPKGIVIQSWRGKEAFYESIKKGYRAILSNGYYIDLIQPASFHYANDPLPDSITLTKEQQENVLGGEATMWSELITPETIDSRIWPRTAAIAERLWSPGKIKDIDDMYRRLDIISLHLEALGLKHEIYKQAMLRRLANGNDTHSLEILMNVIEPLKMYDRNLGDTMYTVFSPFTKIADAATPDQALPRNFSRLIDIFLKQRSAAPEKKITDQLQIWKDNDSSFQVTLRNSPVLLEAAPLSENLSLLATAGLSAIEFLHSNNKAGAAWFEKQMAIVQKAEQQSGRCELQVVAPIEKLIKAASGGEKNNAGDPAAYIDKDFFQEYHDAYPVGITPGQNNVRSIAVDKTHSVWIATAEGIFQKRDSAANWVPVSFSKTDMGPAYAVTLDKNAVVWMGTWKGVFIFHNGAAQQIQGTHGPISLLCPASEGLYALGPEGVWLSDGKTFIKKNWSIARSPRSAVSDGGKGIWVASDVGLYHCNEQGIIYYQGTDHLISASLRGVALDAGGKLWVAGLGGVTILKDGEKERVIRQEEGCPSIHATSVRRSPDGVMWVGTEVGLVRYPPDGSHSLLFSRRWLLNDHVNDITFDPEGNAWIATSQGVSAIKKRKMNLSSKADYFYDVQMKRHIRKPWISGQCHLQTEGDTTSWQPEDDDNDGEYGGNYLTMECFRYAVTKNKDAREKAGKAFAFLRKLREVTGGDGYFARTIVPADWGDKVHDANRPPYTASEKADELVKEPRFKAMDTRWRKSKDGQWLWKGDASSDEWCGHMMGYFFYYQLVANDLERVEIRNHVAALVDHLIAHDFNMMDIDGTHTRWSVWSPKSLNGDPEWGPDQSENSMELLAFLKLAYYMTDNMKYQEHYLKFIKEDHYLDNMARLTEQNPAWFIYYDVIMQCYLYPILIGCEKDPELKAWYQRHLDHWMTKRVGDHNPLINFFYCYARDKKVELKNSVAFLTDTPLDLVSWNIDHTKREDIKLVHRPVLDDLEVNELPPPSIRATVRWDANPWAAISGNPSVEREPVFWLLPYWIGRYLKMIE